MHAAQGASRQKRDVPTEAAGQGARSELLTRAPTRGEASRSSRTLINKYNIYVSQYRRQQIIFTIQIRQDVLLAGFGHDIFFWGGDCFLKTRHSAPILIV